MAGTVASGKGGGGGGSAHQSSVLDHRFGHGPPLTVGVEEEYMLLDPRRVSSPLEKRIRQLVCHTHPRQAAQAMPGG